jgi:hypothetical protein
MPELPILNLDVITATFGVFLVSLGAFWGVNKGIILLKSH